MNNPKPTHVGEVLYNKYLAPFQISVGELCKNTFLPVTRVDAILKGSEKINADVALRLSKYFGTTAKYWLWMQIEFDIVKARALNHNELKNIQPLEKKSVA